jgi:hypothetical protein
MRNNLEGLKKMDVDLSGVSVRDSGHRVYPQDSSHRFYVPISKPAQSLSNKFIHFPQYPETDLFSDCFLLLEPQNTRISNLNSETGCSISARPSMVPCTRPSCK